MGLRRMGLRGPGRVVGAILAVWMLAASASAQTPAALASQLGSRIRTGSVDAPSSNVGFGVAVGVVNAPYDRVLHAVGDYARYHEFLPHFKTSRVLAERGNRAMVYMECGILKDTVTLWAQLKVRSKDEGDKRLVEARMARGNMESFVAKWEVSPLDNGRRALVRFRILVDPDLPLPSSIITKENVKSARRTIEALRNRLNT